MPKSKKPVPAVLVVDDDESVRIALVRLMRSAGMSAEAFSSVEALLAMRGMPQRACLLVDIRMPGCSGLELPALLHEHGVDFPIIFLTAQDTDETRGEAKRLGAAGYFRKPIDDQALLDAIAWALDGGEPVVGT